MRKRLAVIGASGHGKVVADIARLVQYEEIVFLDDNAGLAHCGRYHVAGTSEVAGRLAESGYDLFVAIGDAAIRQRMQERLENENVSPVTLIHPKAVVAEDVEIGGGTVVMAGAVINSGSRIGKGCIVNTCASIDHDSKIDDYVHVSVGAHLAGAVRVGTRTWVGIGAVVSNNADIVGDCMIGAGAVVVGDIKDSGTYVGVPAAKVKRTKRV